MKLFLKKWIVLTTFLIFTQLLLQGQERELLWVKSDLANKNYSQKIDRKSTPKLYNQYTLNIDRLKEVLLKTPNRNQIKGAKGLLLNFPNGQGEQELFEVFEAPVMATSLQKEFPEIRSYVGKSKTNPNTQIRFSITALGIHAMTMEASGKTVFIDPVSKDGTSYMAYYGKDLQNSDPFECLVDEMATQNTKSTVLSARPNNANDGQLRTFRLAVATTGEYSQFHLTRQGVPASATDATKKEAVMSAIVITITRVNGLFERDVSITMELVANNKDIIFLDSAADTFTNNNPDKLILESQTAIDNAIGNENYDIGHTFSTGGGGLAQLPSACHTEGKAKGVTGTENPIGDKYDIDYVAHEMGHQFGAHHTFNGSTGACDGNRNDQTAVEPGSGSTIMGYAGLCEIGNVEPDGQGYFHLVSIREMWNNITFGISTCGELSDTGNSAPTIEPVPDYTIPHSTPFALKAVASDLDGDELTYTWEQLDAEITEVPLVSTATDGPAFRSIVPGIDPVRYFPNLVTVKAGSIANDWEVIPTVSRTMLFGVNVRDNNLAGGQTASEETLLTVDGNSGPFIMTSQTTNEVWDEGTLQTVNWDVAGTDAAPINCAQVNILLSIDGGTTFDIVLAANIPNDGTHDIIVPGGNTTSTARIKIEAVDNVFYTMNAADFTIQASEFVLNFANSHKDVCALDEVSFDITYNTFLGFNEETTFSASGQPEGATVIFDPVSATDNNTAVTMTISNIGVEDVGNHTISVTGTAASTSKTTGVTLAVFSSAIPVPTLISPFDGEAFLEEPYSLTWEAKTNVNQTVVQLSEFSDFNSLIEEGFSGTNNFEPQLLSPIKKYYWRAKHINECGEGEFSPTYSFTTSSIVCGVQEANDTPIDIPDNNTTGIISSIEITESKSITDINVTLSISHTYIEDLIIILEGPNGEQVTLADKVGLDGDSFTNTVFDAEAQVAIASGSAPFSGHYTPKDDLTVLYGTSSLGTWKLIVTDNAEQDLGRLESWSLEICGVQAIPNDDDNDGVENSADLCPDTPFGEPVDTNGCSFAQLDSDNDGVNNDLDLCPDTVFGEEVDANGCSFNQRDDDNDGVNNGNDLCQNTPAGREVDENGCYVFIINADNYTIEVVSETCQGRNNGQLRISAFATYEYSATINDVVYPFTDNELFLEDLAPDDYKIDITIAGEDYLQTFNVTIDPGISTIGAVSTSGKTATVKIDQGTAPYAVYINGVQMFTTPFTTFDVAVEHGDLLEVKTAVDCEGILAKTIALYDAVVAYPNPTQDQLFIAIPFGMGGEQVGVELYTMQAKLIAKQSYTNKSGKIQLDLSHLIPGVYLVRVALDQPIHLKIVKQ